MRVFPNPSEDFSIDIQLEKTSFLNLDVYDLAGKKVDGVYNGRLSGGLHQFSWSGIEAGLSPGIYFLRAISADNSEVIKLIFE